MNKLLIFLSSFVFLFTVSCSSDSEEQEIRFDNVDTDLWSFFDAFEKEGIKRGFNIDLNAAGITGEITSISDDGVAGTCQYGNHIHHVTIDESFWENASENFREYVVFHELGHCFLNRGHNDQASANGNCISIMHSGLTGCRIVYGQNTRDGFLDELFYNE